MNARRPSSWSLRTSTPIPHSRAIRPTISSRFVGLADRRRGHDPDRLGAELLGEANLRGDDVRHLGDLVVVDRPVVRGGPADLVVGPLLHHLAELALVRARPPGRGWCSSRCRSPRRASSRSSQTWRMRPAGCAPLVTQASQRLDREFTICRVFLPTVFVMHVMPTVLPSLRRGRRGNAPAQLDPEAHRGEARPHGPPRVVGGARPREVVRGRRLRLACRSTRRRPRSCPPRRTVPRTPRASRARWRARSSA